MLTFCLTCTISKVLTFVILSLPASTTNSIPATPQSLLTAAATVVANFGQLAFDIWAEAYGRKRRYDVELMIIIIGTIRASMSSNTPDWSLCGYFSLYLASISRLEYFVLIIPCLATIAAEFANKKRRGPMLTAAFSMQDWGTISAYIVAIIFLSIFQGVMNADNQRIGSHLAYSFCVYQIILFLNIVFQLKCSSTGHRYYPLFCCMHLILGPLFGSTEMTSNCKQKRKLLLILFAVGLRIDAHNRRGDRRYMEHRRYQLVCMINDYKSSQIYAT